MKFFVLGTHPSLSLAEIATVLGNEKNYSRRSSEILLLDDVAKDPEDLQDRLAGTIKIGDVVGEVKKFNQDELADFIVSLLSITFRVSNPSLLREKGAGVRGETGNRVTFGISVYACGGNKKELAGEIKKLGMAVKKRLRGAGQTARFVDSKETNLSSAAIVGEKILENGGEFVLIAEPNKIIIGQTRTVQDFQSWSRRDYGRPRRNAKAGMLPPKLARMMINFSTPPTVGEGPGVGVSLLDPFCGSGTVLMEATLMGYTNIIGSDISERAIKDTRINLAWLAQHEGLDVSKIRLFNKPVETLAGELKEKVDLVVAETYLGPPLTGRETPNRKKQIMDELLDRAASSLAALNQLLKDGGTAVLAFPAFCAGHSPATAGQNGKTIQYLPLKKLTEAVDLKIIPFVGRADEISPNGGLFYARKDQLVGREILRIKKSEGV